MSTERLHFQPHTLRPVDDLLASAGPVRPWLYRGPTLPVGEGRTLNPGDFYVAKSPLDPDDVDLVEVVLSGSRRIGRMCDRLQETAETLRKLRETTK